MGLLEKLFGTAPSEDKIKVEQNFKLLTAYQPVFTTYQGSIYESELIRSAIEAKARHISKLKVELQGSAQPELRNKLKHKPNEWMTWPQFLARCSTILDCTNNLFIVPVQNNYYETVGFFPVLPERVKIVTDKNSSKLWLVYKFMSNQTGAVEYDRCAILTKHQYKNDLLGEDNRALANTLDLIALQNQGIEEAIKNSATFRFTAKVTNFTKPEDLKRERERFNQENFRDEASGILLFPNTYSDIQQVTSTPYMVDEKQMSLIKDNVFDYFGVNEDIMQGKANSSQLDAFFNSAIEPFAIQLSEALSKAIYSDLERSYGNHVYVNANRLQYMSVAEKVSMAQQLADRGALTINEIRELFNYPPLPDGDVAVIRGEYYAIDDKVGDAPALIEEGDNNGQGN